MPPSGQELVETIQRDLVCPTCGYNLRGLAGLHVTCPECGSRWDVAKLVALKWDKPWWKAPGLKTISLPSFFACNILLPFLFFSDDTGILLAWTSAAFAGWLLSLYLSWRLFESMRGVYLAMAYSVLIPVYLTCGTACLVSLIFIVLYLLHNRGVPITALVGVVCVVPLYAGRRLEKYIAAQCIRRHLERMGTAQGTTLGEVYTPPTGA
ncbi:MAG: hypothetical protein GC164_00335 [Phycisphaera sp.]|nr:hypothetical protein [Phycisphaera sp.]